ncbi:hypothetical protein N665_0121s0027 [Sinapis alba]|nr:hypothetical protein N665_0121s0027 [Sinapis alba]
MLICKTYNSSLTLLRAVRQTTTNHAPPLEIGLEVQSESGVPVNGEEEVHPMVVNT